MGMNQAPITLILIAAVGLVVVITLGIFFAVKPRASVDKTTYYYSDFRDGPQYEHKGREDDQSQDKPNTKPMPSTTPLPEAVTPHWWTPNSPDLPPPSVTPSRPYRPPIAPGPSPIHRPDLQNLIVPPHFVSSKTNDIDIIDSGKVQIDAVSKNTVEDSDSESEITSLKPSAPRPIFPPSPSRKSSTIPQFPPSPTSPPSPPSGRRPIVPIERRVDSNVQVGKPVLMSSKQKSATDKIPEMNSKLAALELSNQAQFAHYGRVVGLTFDNDFLYVPSHRDGNISILSTPDLKLIKEIECNNCRIYDIAVLSSGELIIAQGKRRALAKLDPNNGSLIAREDMQVASKGIALSPKKDIIYVLTRSHDAIYKYDTDLKPLGSIPIPNTKNDDCNFLAVNKLGELYISCENQVFVLDAEGELVRTLSSARGSYSVGIDVDSENKVYVVRRGKAHIDIYDEKGTLVQSLGDQSDVLWSDLAVGNGHAYVIDYIAVTVQAYKLPKL